MTLHALSQVALTYATGLAMNGAFVSSQFRAVGITSWSFDNFILFRNRFP